MQKKRMHEKPVVKSEGGHIFDYKDVATLSKYVTERGRLIPRSRSGLTSKEQHDLTIAVKRARLLALLPFAN
jgi:small subunit ribosomal protein S18